MIKNFSIITEHSKQYLASADTVGYRIDSEGHRFEKFRDKWIRVRTNKWERKENKELFETVLVGNNVSEHHYLTWQFDTLVSFVVAEHNAILGCLTSNFSIPILKIFNFEYYSFFVVSVDKSPQILTPSTVKLSNEKMTEILDWININSEILNKVFIAVSNLDFESLKQYQKQNAWLPKNWSQL